MSRLSNEYQEKAAREEAEQKKAKRRLDEINAKRSLPHPGGYGAPKFDARGQREVEESRRMDNKRSKLWKAEAK
jgi:hypothetical protein